MQPTRSQPVETYLRGALAHDARTTRDGWRAALDDRAATAQVVQAALAAPVWAEPLGRGALGKAATMHLAALLALLDAVDPVVFAREVDRLRQVGLPPLHRQTLEMMARQMADQPVARLGAQGVPVYVSARIADAARVMAALRRWCRTPGASLQGVTRIDVIADEAGVDFGGLYQVRFSGIVLVWPEEPKGRVLRWLQGLTVEFAFYHELGHHACGHVEGGQDPDQEEQADRHAARLWRQAHPVLYPLARGARLLFGAPLRWLGQRGLRRVLRRDV